MSVRPVNLVNEPAESNSDALLDLSNVTKYFGGLAAVQDVNLVVKPQEIVSVIGPNGAGKTTVFNLITGIYRPSTGEIRFNGQPLTQSVALTEAIEAAVLGLVWGILSFASPGLGVIALGLILGTVWF